VAQEGHLVAARQRQRLRGSPGGARPGLGAEGVVVARDVQVADQRRDEGLQLAQLVLGRALDRLDGVRQLDIQRHLVLVDEGQRGGLLRGRLRGGAGLHRPGLRQLGAHLLLERAHEVVGQPRLVLQQRLHQVADRRALQRRQRGQRLARMVHRAFDELVEQQRGAQHLVVDELLQGRGHGRGRHGRWIIRRAPAHGPRKWRVLAAQPRAARP